MFLDAVLLTIADISAEHNLPVAIFPEMRIAAGDGVLVKNSETQFEAWLSGNVDYGVCTYKDEADRGMKFSMKSYHLVLTIISSDRTTSVLFQLGVFILTTVCRSKTIRYCLSDGHQWMFAMYTCDAQGCRTSYEGIVLTIVDPRPAIQDVFEKDVRRLVEVLYHWVSLRLLSGIATA